MFRKVIMASAGVGASVGLLLLFGAGVAYAEESQSGAEGVRVHGHWTIEVRNPDGTLVEHRDFENALSIGAGDEHLVNVLARTRTPGTWFITANGTPNQICEEPAGMPNECFILESTDAIPPVMNVFKNLTVTVSNGTLILNGTLTAARDGEITAVTTRENHCSNSISPASCIGGNVVATSGFTGTLLGAPVPVMNGQQVQIRVVISFS